MRGFSLRQLPRAEDLSSHDVWRALAVIVGINVLLLLVRPDRPRPSRLITADSPTTSKATMRALHPGC